MALIATWHENVPEVKTVLVTLGADPEWRRAVAEELAGWAEPVFLADLRAADRPAALARAEVILTYRHREELAPEEWRLLTRLALYQSVPTGVEGLPWAEIPERVTVCANAGAWAEPIAEHVLALMLALGKNLLPNHQDLAQGRFNRRFSTRFQGLTAGFVGFGGIGQATAKLLSALGMRLMALNSTGVTDSPVDFRGTLADLERVFRTADAVVLCLPLTKRTRGLVGARELAWLREEAILINVGRGPLVDQAALFAHLQAHPEFKAATDVWWVEPASHGRFELAHPFLDLPNFLGTPHNADHVPGMVAQAIRTAAANVRRYLSGEPVKGRVERGDYL